MYVSPRWNRNGYLMGIHLLDHEFYLICLCVLYTIGKVFPRPIIWWIERNLDGKIWNESGSERRRAWEPEVVGQIQCPCRAVLDAAFNLGAVVLLESRTFFMIASTYICLHYFMSISSSKRALMNRSSYIYCIMCTMRYRFDVVQLKKKLWIYLFESNGERTPAFWWVSFAVQEVNVL